MSAQPLVQQLHCPSTAPGQPVCNIALPIEDAAKLAALAELYPDCSQETLITELLHHALNTMDTHR